MSSVLCSIAASGNEPGLTPDLVLWGSFITVIGGVGGKVVDAVSAARHALVAKEVGSPPHTKVAIAVASLEGSVSVVL